MAFTFMSFVRSWQNYCTVPRDDVLLRQYTLSRIFFYGALTGGFALFAIAGGMAIARWRPDWIVNVLIGANVFLTIIAIVNDGSQRHVRRDLLRKMKRDRDAKKH
jgi:hypothetical protein